MYRTLWTAQSGQLGIFVDPTNDTRRDSHFLSQLFRNRLLLNPVVGIDLDVQSNSSHITLGALAPDDYEGELNWIEASVEGVATIPNQFSVEVKIDGFKISNETNLLAAVNNFTTYLTDGLHLQRLKSDQIN